jgi:hypothetical protein
VPFSTQNTGSRNPLLASAVFGLDRWLRRRQGVYEYSSDPICLFRVNRAAAGENVKLADGTSIHVGDPILNLHLWNEHIHHMRQGHSTVALARQLSHGIDQSLRELATSLAHRPDLDDIIALRADMRLGTSEQSGQLARLSAHYGFETAAPYDPATSGPIHRFGESIFMFLLILATNREALRPDVFWRDHALVYLSRAALERRYGGQGFVRAD